MSDYRRKYKLPFKTYKGHNLRIDIKKLDYLSPDEEYYVGYGVSHVSLKYEDMDLYESVKPSSLSLSLLAESAGQYREFKDANDRDYKVELWEEDVSVTVKKGSFEIIGLSTIERRYPEITLTGGLDSRWYWKLEGGREWIDKTELPYGSGYTGGFCFSDDGTIFYECGYRDDGAGGKESFLYQYNLSTAWDYTTAPSTPDKELSWSQLRATSVTFRDSGTKMYVGFYDTITGDNDGYIYEFDLGTGWEIDTAVKQNEHQFSPGYGVWDIQVSPAAKNLLYVLQAGYIYTYEMSDGGSIDSWISTEYKDAPGSCYSFYINEYDLYFGFYDQDDQKNRINHYKIGDKWLPSRDNWTYQYDIDHPVNGIVDSLFWKTDGEYIYALIGDYLYKGISAEDWSAYADHWNLIIGGTQVAQIGSSIWFTNYPSNAAVINALLQELVDTNSGYNVYDTDGDNYLDTIEKITTNYGYTGSVEIEYTETGETYDCGNFGGGRQGDILRLKTDENGTVRELASIERVLDMNRKDVIEHFVNYINNNFDDYIAETDPDDGYEHTMLITYVGNLVASDVTLLLDEGDDWYGSVSGINANTETGDRLMWTGFNVGGLYKEDYQGYMYEVEIKATDGLVDLKGVDHPFQSGSISYIKLLADSLQQTTLKLRINSAFDLYEDNMVQNASDDPISQMYIEKESVARRSYREVLNEKFKGFQILQDKGEWWVVRIESSASYDYRVFDWKGNYLKNDSYDPVIKFSNAADYRNNQYAVNINQSGVLEIDAGAKYYNTKQSYGLKDQMLKDPTLALFNIDGELRYWDSTNSDIYEQNSDDILNFLGTLNFDEGETEYIEQTNNIQSPELSLKFDLKLLSPDKSQIPSLSFDWQLLDHSVPVENITFYVSRLDISGVTNSNELEVGMVLYLSSISPNYRVYVSKKVDGWLYVRAYDDGELDMITDFDYMPYATVTRMEAMVQLDNAYWYNGEEFEDSETGSQKFLLFEEFVKIDWEDKTISKSFEMGISERRSTKVRLYQPDWVDVLINKVKMGQNIEAAKGRREHRYYEGLNDSYKEEPVKIELFQGDIPGAYSNSPSLFLNGLFLDENLANPTSSWDGGYKYYDLVANRMVDQMAKNGFILTGDFIIPELIPVRSMIHDLILDRKFTRKSLSYDVTMNTFSGEWVEIEKELPSTYIVDTRLFEEEPKGSALYSDNRDTFTSSGGGAGTGDIYITETVDVKKSDITQFSFKAQDLGLIETGSFYGSDLDSGRKIKLNHNRGRAIVFLKLSKNGVRLSPANYEEKYGGDQIEITINVPYEDVTKFEYIIY